MGRPPLNAKVIVVRLPEDVLAEIDALVGNYHRPQFIREAVEHELKRRKLLQPRANTKLDQA